jgi:hypothetical protein
LRVLDVRFDLSQFLSGGLRVLCDRRGVLCDLLLRTALLSRDCIDDRLEVFFGALDTSDIGRLK